MKLIPCLKCLGLICFVIYVALFMVFMQQFSSGISEYEHGLQQIKSNATIIESHVEHISTRRLEYKMKLLFVNSTKTCIETIDQPTDFEINQNLVGTTKVGLAL